MSLCGIIRETLRHLPFSIPQGGRKQRYIVRLLDYLIPTRSKHQIISIGSGMRLSLDLTHYSQRILNYSFYNYLRNFEISDLAMIMRSIKERKDFIFVDIGANLGMFSLLAKQLGFSTLLFEPEEQHYAFLTRNQKIFGDVFNLALSDVSGSATFYVSDSKPGVSSLVTETGDVKSSRYDRKTTVSTLTFDEFLFRAVYGDKARKIKLLKIDVEGNELATLRGMTKFFSSGFRPLIWCEVRDHSSDRNPGSDLAVIDFLRPFDYRPFLMDGSHPRPFIEKKDRKGLYDILFSVTSPPL